jgi:hypothetical protein
MVAENRKEMLTSVLQEIQMVVTEVVPLLVKIGVEPSTPVNTDVLNNRLQSGDDVYTSIQVLLTTMFGDILTALKDSSEVIDSISTGSLTITELGSTARPIHDTAWVRSTAVSNTYRTPSNSTDTRRDSRRFSDEDEDSDGDSGSDDEAAEESALTVAELPRGGLSRLEGL